MSLTLRTIAEATAAYFGVSYVDMVTYRRDTAAARQTAFWLARHLTDKSLPQIGRAFARDHTTVLYGVNQIERERAENPQLAADLDTLTATLRKLSEALVALNLSEKPESDARDIAERVLATSSGPTNVSSEEIRALAIAVVTLDAQMNAELLEPKPEPLPEAAPPAPSFPVMVSAPPLYEPELTAFADAWREFQNAEYGRGERWAREQYELAAARLIKAFRPKEAVSPSKGKHHEEA